MKIFNTLLICFISLNILAQNPKAPVKVTVTNPEMVAIANDKVVFVGQKSGKVITGITNSACQFTVHLPDGEIYDIQIDAIGDDMDYNSLEIPKLPEGAEFQEMELGITYWMGDSFTLSDLKFQTGKSTIMSNSFTTLDELVDYLKRKKELRILVGGHTDNVGAADGNLKLSKDRALAVKAYLVKKGISAGRVRTEGFGMNQPIADNSTVTGRAQNRRTEIQIIE